MTPPLGDIDQILSSARVGGAVTLLTLVLLFFAQALYWRRASAPPALRQWVTRVAALSCAVLLVLISARFVIIA